MLPGISQQLVTRFYNDAVERQYDKFSRSLRITATGDRVYLREFTPKPGLSHKLCCPWPGQFHVVKMDHPHFNSCSQLPGAPGQATPCPHEPGEKGFTLSDPMLTFLGFPQKKRKAFFL